MTEVALEGVSVPGSICRSDGGLILIKVAVSEQLLRNEVIGIILPDPGVHLLSVNARWACA